MNLYQSIDIFGGGAGSGPNAPCPQCGPQSGKKIEEGDVVKINHPIKMWNKRTGDNDKLPAGQKAVVTKILPQVGTSDQMVKVNVIPPSKKYDEDLYQHVKMNDIELHQSGTTFQVNPKGEFELPKYADPTFKPSPESNKEWKKLDIQPVPKNEVLVKFQTKDGANVTWVKTADDPEHSQKTLEEISQTPSSYKGRFDLLSKVAGADNNITRIYDSSKIPGRGWEREGASAASKPGATVWVHRYPDRVVIQEQQYKKWSTKASGIMTFEYKNIGKAFGMLKNRYGISIKLKGDRF